MAISDALGLTAQGLPTLKRTRIREDLDEVKRLATQWGAELILLGNPLHMDGTESRQSAYTREFAEKLVTRTGLRVAFWDERLTSVEAERVLRQSGIGIEKRAKAVDQLAAQLLLENYLSAQGSQSFLPEEGLETEPAS